MSQENKEPLLSKNIIPILFVILVLSLISAVIAIYYYNSTFGDIITADHERWGTFGDFFGGTLNSIFSFLSLLAILLTIIIQNKELSLSTIEFAKSAKALTEQSESIRTQNFENTFFKLISLHNEIVDSLEYLGMTKRKCFSQYIKSLGLNKTGNKSVDDITKEIPINITYDIEYNVIASSVEHYHKNLYQIISFVHTSGIKENKKQYTNFIRSQLSRDELNLLFLHALSKYGVEKFKKLIEQYEMFEHLPADTFLLKENIHLYDKKAFGANKDLLALCEQTINITNP